MMSDLLFDTGWQIRTEEQVHGSSKYKTQKWFNGMVYFFKTALVARRRDRHVKVVRGIKADKKDIT